MKRKEKAGGSQSADRDKRVKEKMSENEEEEVQCLSLCQGLDTDRW